MIRFSVTKPANIEPGLKSYAKKYGPEMLAEDKWVFSREIAKVFTKPNQNWIRMCEKLITFCFHTIRIKRYRENYTEQEFSKFVGE
jgi:hypothetical protein